MSTSGTYTVKFRRRLEGKTNYHKRLKLLLSGKPRLVIRKSLNNIYLQIIVHKKDGDNILVSANSQELEKYGWKLNCGNLPAAYLAGLLIAKKASKNSIKEAICDIGLVESTKGNRVYSALKGAVDGGLEVPHSKDVLPDDNRIKGVHIKNAEIPKQFETAKANIEKI